MSNQRKQVVLVTGASRGIGLAVTKALLETFNVTVVAASRSRSPELLELLKKHPATFLSIEADLTNEAATREAVGLAIKTYTHLDGLVLNAGTLEPIAKIGSPETTTDSWRAHFELNFFSLLYTVQAALSALRSSESGGRIVFVSSGAATGATPAWGVYNASKAAMNSFCRTLANEEPGITCVALRPGMVDTPMQELLRSKGPSAMTEENIQKFINAHKEGKLVKPEDVGHVIGALSLKAPNSLSGKFVNWDGDECNEFRKTSR